MNIPNETGLLLGRLAGNSVLQTAVFQPEFIRIHNANDLDYFYKILQTPNLVVVDEISVQLKELIRLQNPALRLNAQDYERLISEHLMGRDIRSYGVWVLYPWSNRLVHLLDEKEFIEVRTSRNQYKITPEERELLATKKIGVIGLSVGQSVSVTLAMERICGELRLADFDALELTNLNRIRTGVHNLGLLKVYAVAREIAELDPFLKVSCFPQGLTEENMDDFFSTNGLLDLVVEESDGFDIKILSRYKARELKIPVIMEASDRCMVDVERFDLENERPILHGLLDHLDPAKLKTLTTNEQKIPYMFDILGLKSTSAKLKASMLEMQQTITTWPQLASAVTMGGGITADVSRRILLNDFKSSGRYYVDIDELIGDAPAVTEIPLIENVKGKNYSVNTQNLHESHASDDELFALAAAARYAPSFANAQDWKWISSEGNLFLFQIPSKLKYSDPDGKLTLLSAGMAIENVFQKAAEFKLQTKLILKPDPQQTALIAQLSFLRSDLKVPNLSEFIPKRFTSRNGGKIVIEKELKQKLSDLTNSSLPVAILTDPALINQLSISLAKAEKIALLHPDLHGEFFSEILNRDISAENRGLNLDDLQLPEAMKIAYSVLSEPTVAKQLNKWNKGLAFENYYRSLYSESAALVLLSAKNNTQESILEAGRLAERTWLSMTKNNLGVHPICVSLTLLKLNKNKIADILPFTDSAKTEIEELGGLMDKLFDVDTASKGLFLFRITAASAPFEAARRKSLHELYISTSGDSL